LIGIILPAALQVVKGHGRTGQRDRPRRLNASLAGYCRCALRDRKTTPGWQPGGLPTDPANL